MKTKAMLVALSLVIAARTLSASGPTPTPTAVPTPVPVPASFQTSGLTFDSSMILNLYNTVQQTNQQITSFNAGPDGGVVSLNIRNTGTVDDYCYFYAVVSQPGASTYSCSNGVLYTSPLLRTIAKVPHGQTVMVNINGMMLAPNQQNPNGVMCSNFENNIKNMFQSNTGSNVNGQTLANAVNFFEKATFLVCIVVTDSGGNRQISVGDCSTFQLFAQPPANVTTCAILIYPHNNGIEGPLPAFTWTEAFNNGSPVGIQYELVITTSEGGVPWYSVMIPAGQTYYQYQASDKALEPNVKYWFHVVSMLSNGSQKPVGGQNGQGWNTEKWFIYNTDTNALEAGPALVNYGQLDVLIQSQAKPPVKLALTGMNLESIVPLSDLADPDLLYLLSHPSEITNITVVKQ